jgi:hypothetical protein
MQRRVPAAPDRVMGRQFTFPGRLIGRTCSFGVQNRGSNPLPGAQTHTTQVRSLTRAQRAPPNFCIAPVAQPSIFWYKSALRSTPMTRQPW